ncbi:PQQ-dependent sugar dehydrogenase [Aridibaculum aurantiacum]|uniref:PQQ-dependent sugar dehydrogenase n=1 Tax=Aridibaculum aurantiacum TaxID=2810307 RepID=UPI001A973FF2|nr:PQQ-dependent sugar dehydrogenase [Aridibaculum aurantiacum]
MQKLTCWLVAATISFAAISCIDKQKVSNGNVAAAGQQEVSKDLFQVQTLVKGLQNPWGMVFLPDGRMLVTERAGSIRIIQNDQLQAEKIQGVPEVYARGQGGLMDIVLHPDYRTNGWIYISYAKPGNGGGTTTVARAKLQGNQLVGLQELFSVHPYINSGVHFGSRIVFDGKGYMYISTGERGNKQNAQDLTTHNGKVIRLFDDGRVPPDNPFVNRSDAKPEIWSYGHRNIQGMVYDESKNILWAHEHGPRGGDELNIVQKAKNYGWPLVTHGKDYDGTVISDKNTMEGIEPSIHQWTPSIAPCGMALVRGNKYKGWKGNLLVGALAHKHVARVVVNNGKYVSEEKLLDGLGRVRAVSESPDGIIYVLTEGPDQLIRLNPK